MEPQDITAARRTLKMAPEKRVTVSCFRKRKAKGEKIVSLTAYDASTARIIEDCGVDMILVGDSLGMTVLGYRNTIPVTLDDIVHHSKAVRRGAPNSFIVADMPFMTYQISPEDAMRNAARLLQEAGVDAVKIEGGVSIAPTIKRLVEGGIPVVAHIGLLPQSVLTSGGYKIAGKTHEDAERLKKDAMAVQEAGAFAVVLEGIPTAPATEISAMLEIPTIGIGAGIGCDGQVQVINDILGLFSEFVPKHAKKYADLSSAVKKAVSDYSTDVREKKFPGPEHSF